MDLLFGRKKTPAEMLREHQRALQRAQREMDRERVKLEASEKKLIADIKKAAKENQMSACKIMAKDLVRTRRYAQKFQGMKAQLQAVSLRIQTLRSNQQMTEAMRGATKIMMEFEKESEMMDMKEEVMNDVIDDTMAEEDDEEETEMIVNQVLDEIGITLDQSLVDAPTTIEKAKTNERVPQAAEMESSDDAALQARLDQLRRE
ncbi:10783_t:CDS:2 [Entrophospora sp. SA101]|nr:10783_t:CDS:2 [Entrophospora sp. SA101]